MTSGSDHGCRLIEVKHRHAKQGIGPNSQQKAAEFMWTRIAARTKIAGSVAQHDASGSDLCWFNA